MFNHPGQACGSVLIWKMLVHAGKEIRHDQGARELRLDWLQEREFLSGTGDFHGFTFLDPPGHSGKGIAEIANGCRLHCETNMYHEIQRSQSAFCGLRANGVVNPEVIIIPARGDP